MKPTDLGVMLVQQIIQTLVEALAVYQHLRVIGLYSARGRCGTSQHKL
jgi:hypothetical protein